MGADCANARIVERQGDECRGGLGGVTAALVARDDAIRNLDDAVRVGRTFEARRADHQSGVDELDSKAVNPRVSARRRTHHLDPRGRDVVRLIKVAKALGKSQAKTLLERIAALDEREQLLRREGTQTHARRCGRHGR